jgi:hypothetical protein
VHQNTYNLYSWKPPTFFDPAGSSSGRIVCYTVGYTYTVKWECAFAFILRWEVSCTVRGQQRGILYCPRSAERYLVLSAVSREVPCTVRIQQRGALYCPRSAERCLVLSAVSREVPCTVRGQQRGALYCPRSGYTLTADSTRYLSTEDESKGTFSRNCISASNSVTDYSPWRWPRRVETCRRFLQIKIVCILVH